MLNLLLIAAALTSPAEAARRSFLPTAPPVNVRTGAAEGPYWGVGYLQFAVTLPTVINPDFTLGGDEEASYDIGDAYYSAQGMALAFGRPDEQRSRELALVGGRLDARLASDGFEYAGISFSSEHEREGGFAGVRTSSARQLYAGERLVLDWGLNSLLGTYWLRGNTRVESLNTTEYAEYITWYQEKLRGLAWRPVATLQPAFQLTKRVTVIPFFGASAFLSIDRGSSYVLEWEDARYGEDCQDGCPESYTTTNLVPLEPFVGFDVELQITSQDRISLSSLFKATDPTNTDRISEVYALYSRTPRR